MRKIEKRFVIISIALVSLLCIGAVSAADDIAVDDVAAVDTGDIEAIDDYVEENDDLSLEIADVAEDNPPTEAVEEDVAESNDVLGEDAPKTFTQLKQEIANPTDGVVTLSGTYKYDETADAAITSGIVIRSNVTINGPATIDGSNLSRIFYIYQSSATLNGLTLINGKSSDGFAGAIMARESSPTIENCIFKNNLVTDASEDQAYGAAIYFYLTVNAIVNNCTFEDNIAAPEYYGYGGAIYDYGDGLTVKDSIFRNNQAFAGGAFYSYGTNLDMDNCLFDSNKVVTGSAPYYSGEGGAILFDYVIDYDTYQPVECNNTVTRCIFINNQAGHAASAMKNDAATTTVSDCIFLGPGTLDGNSIVSGLESGAEAANNWFGHTVDNASTYISGSPQSWYVLDLNAVAAESYYDIILSLNKLYDRSTGEITDYADCKISDILFNASASVGLCDETVNIQNGVGTFKYYLFAPDEGTVTVDCNGITKSLTLQGLDASKSNASIMINVENIKVGEKAKVEVQLIDSNNLNIESADLIVVVNGVEYNKVTDAEGKCSFEVEGLTAGDYAPIAIFNGNYAYNPAYNSTLFNVEDASSSKLNVDVSVDGGNIIVKVTDEDGNPVDGAKVNITVDGAIQEYTTENGTVTIPTSAGGHNMTISTGEGKELIVKVYTTGEDKPAPASKTNTVITCAHTTISTYNKAIDTKDNAYVLVTLKDANGKALANKAFQFIYQGKAYKYTTDAKGQKKINILLANQGTISPVILFAGDDQYSSSFKAVNVKINPQKVKLVAKKKTFKATKKVKKYTATLKNSKGKAIKGKKVVFTINKKKYTAKTNKKGVVTVKVKLTKKGTYKVTVKFAGDKTYKKATKKAKIKIK